MAWSTPKTDWAAGDPVGPADFNRMEENAAVRQFMISGTVGGQSSFAFGPGDRLAQKTIIEIPDDYEIVLERIGWHSPTSTVGLKVSGASTWTSGTAEGFAEPGTVLESNTSGAAIDMDINIYHYLISGTSETLETYSGWHMALSLRAV